jgi:hypothetical protein
MGNPGDPGVGVIPVADLAAQELGWTIDGHRSRPFPPRLQLLGTCPWDGLVKTSDCLV